MQEPPAPVAPGFPWSFSGAEPSLLTGLSTYELSVDQPSESHLGACSVVLGGKGENDEK
jgi:hypothetical protein